MNCGKMQLIMEKPFREVYGHKKYDTVYLQAACLMEGIIRLHPFQDGNKRTALLMTSLFMEANDVYMVVPIDVVRFMIEIADDDASTEDCIDALICRIARWLEERSAMDVPEFDAKLSRYVNKPLLRAILLSLAGFGILRARKMFRKWFALDMPSDRAKNDPASTLRLIFKLILHNQRAVRDRDPLESN